MCDDTASVDIILGDLNGDPGLSEAEFEINYDDSILSFASGSIWYAAEAADFDEPGSGYVYGFIENISQNPQPDDEFVIATLNFIVIEAGESQLSLNRALSTFMNGVEINIPDDDEHWSDGSITVVPFPGAIWLFITGGLTLAGFRKRCKK